MPRANLSSILFPMKTPADLPKAYAIVKCKPSELVTLPTIFANIVGKVTSSDGLHFTIAYALGRSAGVFIGNKIEERLALGILEVDLFLNNKSKMIKIAEELRDAGYTVNNYSVSGNNGDKRYKVETVIKRKEFKIFEDIVDDCGVSKPTLKIKNLSKVDGKITTTKISGA